MQLTDICFVDSWKESTMTAAQEIPKDSSVVGKEKEAPHTVKEPPKEGKYFKCDFISFFIICFLNLDPLDVRLNNLLIYPSNF